MVVLVFGMVIMMMRRRKMRWIGGGVGGC